MSDFIIQPQEVSTTPFTINYKSGTSTVSFGQKTHNEAPQPMIGFKFASNTPNAIISIIDNSQSPVAQKSMKTTPSNTRLRPSSVTPVKRAARENSVGSPSRPGSAVRGRALHLREVGVTNVPGMTEYINKRSQDRSVELHVRTKEENRKVQAKTKVSGKVVLDTTNQRRQLERQAAELENRIKRLQTEESIASKKIEETDSKTQQSMANKMRSCEEKAIKEMRSKKREESIQRQREENLKTREELKQGMRKSLIGKMKDNYEQAQVLKRVNEEKMEVVLADKRKAAEEKRAANKALIESINANKYTRVAEDETVKKETSKTYADKANIERERARDLSLKCKELEKMEMEMLAKLNATKDLLSAKKTHFSKVSAAKGVIAVDRSMTEN